MLPKKIQAKAVSRLVYKLMTSNYFGDLRIVFTDGNVVHLVQEQSLKLEAVAKELLDEGGIGNATSSNGD